MHRPFSILRDKSKLWRRFLRAGRVGIPMLVLLQLYQNCARVDFQQADLGSNSVVGAGTDSGPQIFSVASTGALNAPDENNEIFLSGSLEETPVMAASLDAANESLLTSGFYSIFYSSLSQ